MKNFLCLCFLLFFTVLPLTSFRTAEDDFTNIKNSIVTADEFVDNLTNLVDVNLDEVTDFIMVKASYYNPVMSQCDSTPLITASGDLIDTTRTTALRWCAISYNLHTRYGGFLNFGDVVEIEGVQGNKRIKGKYIVHDLMNPKWTNKVDILRGTGEKSVTYDSVKLKNPKVKKFKSDVAHQTKTTANSIRRQAMYHTINKFFSKIPFIGSVTNSSRPIYFKERICERDLEAPRGDVSLLLRQIIIRNT